MSPESAPPKKRVCERSSQAVVSAESSSSPSSSSSSTSPASESSLSSFDVDYLVETTITDGTSQGRYFEKINFVLVAVACNGTKIFPRRSTGRRGSTGACVCRKRSTFHAQTVAPVCQVGLVSTRGYGTR